MATRPPNSPKAKSKPTVAPVAKPAKAKAVAKQASVPMRSQMKVPAKKKVAEPLVDTIKRHQIPTLVVGERGRITLPAEVREKLGLDAGSLLILVTHPEGYMELIPAAAVPRDQLRYYSQEMLDAFAEAKLEHERGETYVANTPEELQALLDSWKTEGDQE